MLRLTLDTNCIIDLEQGTGNVEDLRTLVALHESSDIELCVVAVAASERQRDGTYAKTFEEFRQRLDSARLGSLRVLKPVGYWDMAFWDWFIWAGPEDVELLRSIHGILFPQIEDDYKEYCAARGINPEPESRDRTWRNAKCDVITLWAHLHYEGDILVTNDGNFQAPSKQRDLQALGLREVVRTSQVLARVTEIAESSDHDELHVRAN